MRVYLAQGRLLDAERVLVAAGFSFGEGRVAPDLESARTSLPAVAVLYNSALRVLLYRARQSDESDVLPVAFDLVKRLLAQTLAQNQLPVALETLLIRTQMYIAGGDTTAGLKDVAHALQLAEPEGLISLFVDEGQPIKHALITLDQQQPISKPYIRRILAAFNDAARPEGGALMDPLTARERDVLHLMAEGLTYQQIADRLVISLNTVRFYVKEIYSKLHVHNRTQALEHARQQNLL